MNIHSFIHWNSLIMGFRRLDAKTVSVPMINISKSSSSAPPPPPATYNVPYTNYRANLLSPLPLPAANVLQQQPVDLLNQTTTTQQQQHGLPNSVSVLIIVVPASLILLLFGIFLYIFLQYYNHHHGSSTNNNNKSKDVEQSTPNSNIIMSKKLQQDMINIKFQTKQLGTSSGSPWSLHNSTPVDARNTNGGMSSSSGGSTDHHQNCTTLVAGRRSSANSSSLRSVNHYLNYSCSTTSSSSNSSSSNGKGGGGGGQVFTYRSLETATDGFSSGNVIGNGRFGVVYKGVLKDGTVAAVKRLNSQTKHGDRDFRMEVDLLSRLQSPYVVPLLGYCADQNHRILVFQYMTNGSLQDHLYTNTTSSINGRGGGGSAHLDHQSAVAHGIDDEEVVLGWDIRLRIALDCAKGLGYLHEFVTPSIIHRHFKSSNVLLDRDYRAKVSDFGLAKMGSDKLNGLVATRVLGTTGYVAPEYAATGRLTTKSDVYSFGVVLLELITGRVPVNTKRPAGEQALVSWALPRLTNREKVAEMVDPSLQGHYSLKDLIQVAAIAAMCVQPEADYRPLITDVVQSLIPLVKNQASASNVAASTPSELQHHQLKTLRTLSVESGLSSKNSLSNSPRLV